MTAITTPGTYLERLRAEAPLVQCITNYVAMNIAANVLLAAGASPAMVHAEEEAEEFAGFSGAVTINMGTISPAWVAGMKAAAKGATAVGRPWVLDPVAHMATAYRRRIVGELMALNPTIIRGNASEIIALSGGASAAKGVDAKDPVEAAEAAAKDLASAKGCVVAVTGLTDYVTDGSRAARISGGSAFMPQVTALGCSLTALVGAYAALEPGDVFGTTIAALAHFAVAGEEAHRGAGGPGSFSVAFLDTLARIDRVGMDSKARVVLL